MSSPPVTDRDTDPAALTAERLRVGYDGRTVIDGLDLVVPPGQVTAVVGPNGCGKSTLLRALGRIVPVADGRVLLDGQDLRSLPTRAVARRLALLPQSPTAPPGITVHELVSRGRHPHRTWLRQWTREDAEVVDDTLARTGLTDLAHRAVDELSGGQRQRAWIALALAQQTPLLLLDEPTTYLDLAHQVDVLDLVRDLVDLDGRTVVMVLHDLSLAARYADHLVVLRDGALLAQGAPADVVTADLLHEAFGLQAQVIPDPLTGSPLVVPLTRRHTAVPVH